MSIDDKDYSKLMAKTHYFDLESREVVEIKKTIEEAEVVENPIVKEHFVNQIVELQAKKKALEILSEDTTEIDEQIQSISENYIDQKEIPKSEKEEQKELVLQKI